ncbi:MAG: Rid family detoxifying hydrolase [Gammaproteobacteria bacterium]|nr:Rid family detoxifying hydrolase [Gammaproteobacteria bacterium]MCY4322143.1 Rid family detoxifying hydrolase [Gammaproteobacteria bacterium]
MSQEHQAIFTENAPAPVGAYSQAMRAGGFLFVSGQVPLAPGEKSLVSDDVEAQIHQVFKNLQAVIEAGGVSFAQAVKLTVYLADLGDFQTVNRIMAEYVPEPFPARVAIQAAALPLGAAVEIDAILFCEG